MNPKQKQQQQEINERLSRSLLKVLFHFMVIPIILSFITPYNYLYNVIIGIMVITLITLIKKYYGKFKRRN